MLQIRPGSTSNGTSEVCLPYQIFKSWYISWLSTPLHQSKFCYFTADKQNEARCNDLNKPSEGAKENVTCIFNEYFQKQINKLLHYS